MNGGHQLAPSETILDIFYIILYVDKYHYILHCLNLVS